jgi:hypothetical protein
MTKYRTVGVEFVGTWDGLEYDGADLPDITVSVPVGGHDTVSQIIEMYWATRLIDPLWHPWFAYSVANICDQFPTLTVDAIHLICRQQPQARVEGHKCDRCGKEFWFSSRGQLAALLKRLRDKGTATCDVCLRDERQRESEARKAAQKAEWQEHPWTFTPERIAQIRSFASHWNVRETIAQRRASCRECGQPILKGESRLTFSLVAPEGQVREGHIHSTPCSAVAATAGV